MARTEMDDMARTEMDNMARTVMDDMAPGGRDRDQPARTQDTEVQEEVALAI